MGRLANGSAYRRQVARLRDAKGAPEQILSERIMEAIRTRAEVQTTARHPAPDINAHASRLVRHKAHEIGGLTPIPARSASPDLTARWLVIGRHPSFPRSYP